MSQYNGMTLTTLGLSLQTKCQAGAQLLFTRVALGSGQLSQGQLMQALTALINPQMNLPITAAVVSGTGTAQLSATLQNTTLVTGFYASEIGLFATDPQLGEILYAYANAGNTADYIPAGGGADVVNLVFQVVTVVGQASNVTANITVTLYATQADFLSHVNSITDPHPNWLQKGPQTTTATHFWAQQAADGKLRPIALADAQAAILGGNANTIPVMSAQIDATNRELSNMALYMQAMQTYPDYNALIAEGFTPITNSDVFGCQITSVGAGSNSLGVATLQGIVEGSWYTVTDGVNQEQVQITSVIQNGSTLRAQLASNIVNTYNMATAMLYRSTAQIISGTVGQPGSGNAQGAGNQSASVWAPSTIWTGTIANSVVVAALLTTQANSGSFTITGNIAFDASGNVTLV